MKTKDYAILKDASREELLKKVRAEQSTLEESLKDRYTKQSKNVRSGRSMRKTIAQLKTLIRQKELMV